MASQSTAVRKSGRTRCPRIGPSEIAEYEWDAATDCRTFKCISTLAGQSVHTESKIKVQSSVRGLTNRLNSVSAKGKKKRQSGDSFLVPGGSRMIPKEDSVHLKIPEKFEKIPEKKEKVSAPIRSGQLKIKVEELTSRPMTRSQTRNLLIPVGISFFDAAKTEKKLKTEKTKTVKAKVHQPNAKCNNDSVAASTPKTNDIVNAVSTPKTNETVDVVSVLQADDIILSLNPNVVKVTKSLDPSTKSPVETTKTKIYDDMETLCDRMDDEPMDRSQSPEIVVVKTDRFLFKRFDPRNRPGTPIPPDDMQMVDFSRYPSAARSSNCSSNISLEPVRRPQTKQAIAARNRPPVQPRRSSESNPDGKQRKRSSPSGSQQTKLVSLPLSKASDKVEKKLRGRRVARAPSSLADLMGQTLLQRRTVDGATDGDTDMEVEVGGAFPPVDVFRAGSQNCQNFSLRNSAMEFPGLVEFPEVNASAVVEDYPGIEDETDSFVANQVDPEIMFNHKQELASQGDFVKYAKLLQIPGKMESGYMTLANGRRAGVSRNAPDVQLTIFVSRGTAKFHLETPSMGVVVQETGVFSIAPGRRFDLEAIEDGDLSVFYHRMFIH